MNIKTKLKIIISFIILVSTFFSSALYLSLQNYEKVLENEITAAHIAYLIFERRYLAEQYLAYPNDRIKSQWFAKQNVLKELVNSSKENINTDSVEYGSQIYEKLNQSENIFDQITKLGLENADSSSSAFLQEKKIILSSQLALKAQETISLASKVEEVNRERVQQLLSQIIYLFSTVASLFFAMLLASFWVIWGSTKKLEEEDERFNFVARATNDAVYDWNIITNELKFNESMQKLFQYSKKEVIETLEWWNSKIHPEDQKQVSDNLDRAIQSGSELVSLEYRFQRADGTYAFVHDRGYVIRDSANKPIREIGVMQDVSHDKELEKMKDEFVSIASHELRTPMTAIKGFVSMILEGDYGEVSEKIKEPLHDIASATERLIHLVNDMLNVSRIEAGRLKYEISEFNIQDVAQEVVNTLSPIAKEKNIQFQVTSTEPAMVSADSDKVKQMLNNLLGNSLKFVDKGSIAISWKIDGEVVKVFVTDTGMGIAQEDQEKLFGKFQQISNQQKGRPAGTGLGLYITKQIAQKMGGDLWLEESILGKGSTFAFSIPLAKSLTAQKAREAIDIEAKNHKDQVSN